MSGLTFDAKAAKSLCTPSEYKIYESCLPGKLEKLNLVALRDLADRSRTARDKWKDIGQDQKRSTQAQRGHRQNAENARSADKSLMFEEVHQVFMGRLKEIENNEVEAGEKQVEAGKKGSKAPRSDRKTVTRAARSETRKSLTEEKQKLNREKIAQEKSLPTTDVSATSKTTKTAKPGKTAAKTTAAKTTATKVAATKTNSGIVVASKTTSGKVAATKATADKSAGKSAGNKVVASKAQASKAPADKTPADKTVTNKTTSIKTSAKKSNKKKEVPLKKPIMTKARKKLLAKQAEVAAESESKAPPSKPNMNAGLTQAANQARNRPLQAKSTANRIKSGGNTRIKGHISSQGKRSQARRDGK